MVGKTHKICASINKLSPRDLILELDQFAKMPQEEFIRQNMTRLYNKQNRSLFGFFLVPMSCNSFKHNLKDLDMKL